ncbi:hypothetical protein BD289DRAFT_434880 [Coniella lustricola]|uniref:Indoleamine 2,3-dioxygenase n=1 Tax=Coniella lustricola TaxID=2025994 RepID=A0A2T3A6Z8_9PEZI|nr:hypothetical protein BD289DRAFT_434880 [Coniella lustricola]
MAHLLYYSASILVVLIVLFVIRNKIKKTLPPLHDNQDTLEMFRRSKQSHELALLFIKLVDMDGAGNWPPRVDHENWPAPLRPYKDIYLQLIPFLAVDVKLAYNDEANIERRRDYRASMRKLLAERVDLSEVKRVLALPEANQWTDMSREAYNGFYCCLAVCRHAYRWAMIPVVKVAQLETTVDFPPELDLPWPNLQRMFGVEADSGNNTANVLHNFDNNGDRVYKINVSLAQPIRDAEDVFFKLFYDIEDMAVPIYWSMISAVMAFESGDKRSCLRHVRNVSTHLRTLLSVFYDNLHEQRISVSVWLSYIQGFQGWGVGHYIDTKLVKYDGLSGNHVLFFQALDAFLGIGQYLTDENMSRYIPYNQRELCYGLRRHSIRNKLKTGERLDDQIDQEMSEIIKKIRVFRSAHRFRVMPYLEQPAPERLPMTAGKSVLKGDTIKEALKTLDDMMVTRIAETV